jgi:hypothetical protein
MGEDAICLLTEGIGHRVGLALAGVRLPNDADPDADSTGGGGESAEAAADDLTEALVGAATPWLTRRIAFANGQFPDELTDEVAELVAAAVAEFDDEPPVDESGLVADVLAEITSLVSP